MLLTHDYLTIADVAEQTGLAKEVLRKWETRYGFPVPDRDAVGQRLYSTEQARRLKLIKQLLDDGMRPGQIVPLEETHLTRLRSERCTALIPQSASALAKNIVQWLNAHDSRLLHDQRHHELAQRGLRDFILDAMPTLNAAVGIAWSNGAISVKEEHLYTETVHSLLRHAISGHAAAPSGPPRILLTTPPGELHILGLLMVEGFMLLEGVACISLGAQLPLVDIASASQAYRIDIVGLSFSASFPRKKILPVLRELRSLCPAEIDIWAGGAGVARMEKVPRGVSVIPTLEGVSRALQSYRCRHK